MLTNNPNAVLAKTVQSITYDELAQVRRWLKQQEESEERDLCQRILAQIEAYKDQTELTQLRMF